MTIFTISYYILTIILFIANLYCNHYCKKHNIDPTKFTIAFQIGTLCLMTINAFVFIVFNYSVFISQLPHF